MAKSKNEAREKIINATTQLIRDYGDISKITVRDIAINSEVGVGLINYHFQTKENLINICILRIISHFIDEIDKLYKSLELSPIDKLKYVFKLKCDFVVVNCGISKISMLLDLNSGEIGDNTDQAAKVHLNILKDVFQDQKSENELFIILHILMSSIQVAFLRSNVLKVNTNIDFFNKDQREKFIDSLIDSIIVKAQ